VLISYPESSQEDVVQDNISAEKMLTEFKQDVEKHPSGMRWAHTYGVGAIGQFVASDVARHYCIAEPFEGPAIAVTVRFSNGSSELDRHDNWPDTRGMAVKFHLTQAGEYDLLAMTLNVFGASTRQQFIDIAQKFHPKQIRPESWLRRQVLNPLLLRSSPPALPIGMEKSGGPGLAQYAGTHGFVRDFVIGAGLARVPASWGRNAYHAVHTFWAVTPERNRQPVRFSWQPVDGVFPLPASEIASSSNDFLGADLQERLEQAPIQFTLKMTIGDPGDDVNDPTVPWPVTRRFVNMGMLHIHKISPNGPQDVEHLSFNPMRLPAGLEPSDDQILHARGEIYQLGCAERGAIGCPYHIARDDQ
jgi:catalase